MIKNAWEPLLVRTITAHHFKLVIIEDILGFELQEQGGQRWGIKHSNSQ